jgi:hypothetical protein
MPHWPEKAEFRPPLGAYTFSGVNHRYPVSAEQALCFQHRLKTKIELIARERKCPKQSHPVQSGNSPEAELAYARGSEGV